MKSNNRPYGQTVVDVQSSINKNNSRKAVQSNLKTPAEISCCRNTVSQLLLNQLFLHPLALQLGNSQMLGRVHTAILKAESSLQRAALEKAIAGKALPVVSGGRVLL